MLGKKADKFCIYPNKEQRILTAKTIGCARFVCNHFLGKWNENDKKRVKDSLTIAVSSTVTIKKSSIG